ncbi:hypothetical protein Vadar_001670 [Vaccinium darrowii]|uniref:Uncharacterized protein n=1 Tax=Vaccinium darrowii TaxID=229202 RepID=A0ACB7Y4G3_9ERIC|nr:hypothetical protein Vadar_001670 [Vaccinium darrowii]
MMSNTSPVKINCTGITCPRDPQVTTKPVKINCTVITCPTDPQVATKNFSSSAEACPEYFKWIHEDLRPWKDTGVTKDMVDSAEKRAYVRIVVVNGRVYVKKLRWVFETRDVFTVWGILQLLRLYPGEIPDLDIMFQMGDSSVIKMSEYPGSEDEKIPVMFHYCGSDSTFDITFPDWSFWVTVLDLAPLAKIVAFPGTTESSQTPPLTTTPVWVFGSTAAAPTVVLSGGVDSSAPFAPSLPLDPNTQTGVVVSGGPISHKSTMGAHQRTEIKPKPSGPEVNVKPWETFRNELDEGNHKVKWKDREPYAYWRGNPLNQVRQNLLRCNVSEKPDSGAMVYQLDWQRERKGNFKHTDYAKQCTHRSIKFAVDWGNNYTQEAQEIGKAGSKFLQEELQMKHVYDYMFHLLYNYGKLLKYTPTVPEGAVELCLESMACSASEKVKKFLIDSMVKGPADSGPCILPKPYDSATLQDFIQQKANLTKQVEKWEEGGSK